MHKLSLERYLKIDVRDKERRREEEDREWEVERKRGDGGLDWVWSRENFYSLRTFLNCDFFPYKHII